MATYTVGQVLPNGFTVTADTVVNEPDGSTLETILSRLQVGVDQGANPIFSTQSETIFVPGAGTPAANLVSLQSKAVTALTNNIAFLGQAAPTFPLTTAEQQALVAQVAALTRQVDALIYLALQALGSTSGT